MSNVQMDYQINLHAGPPGTLPGKPLEGVDADLARREVLKRQMLTAHGVSLDELISMAIRETHEFSKSLAFSRALMSTVQQVSAAAILTVFPVRQGYAVVLHLGETLIQEFIIDDLSQDNANRISRLIAGGETMERAGAVYVGDSFRQRLEIAKELHEINLRLYQHAAERERPTSAKPPEPPPVQDDVKFREFT